MYIFIFTLFSKQMKNYVPILPYMPKKLVTSHIKCINQVSECLPYKKVFFHRLSSLDLVHKKYYDRDIILSLSLHNIIHK